MNKHTPSEERKKELDIMLSKINALEIISSDEWKKGVIKVLRTLVENQIHSIDEFDHLKKAIDLLTLELFEVRKKNPS